MAHRPIFGIRDMWAVTDDVTLFFFHLNDHVGILKALGSADDADRCC